MWNRRRTFVALALPRLRNSARMVSTSRCALKDTDPLSALFEEMETLDTSSHAREGSSPAKAESTVESSPPLTSAASAKPSDARVRLEESKQKRLRRQLHDATEELNALVEEKARTAAMESSKAYVPAQAAKTFLSSAELIQEKAPQEFVASDASTEEVAKLPSLQHSGCSAVITMVGVVTEAPKATSAIFPGDQDESSCVDFMVKYNIPFAQSSVAMEIRVRVVGVTLCAFAQENIGVGDVVHVLGHLAPLEASETKPASCAVYVLPAGGNISVVLSTRAQHE